MSNKISTPDMDLTTFWKTNKDIFKEWIEELYSQLFNPNGTSKIAKNNTGDIQKFIGELQKVPLWNGP